MLRNISHYLTLGLLSVLLAENYSGDEIKKNKMGGACGTYGGRET
jgi:hypothetical protein